MMKKAYSLLTICTLAFVFLSCNQGIFDQDAVQTAGTVYLNVGGQQGRAVDSEGLPVLKDAQMDLKIVSSGKSETVTLPAGAEKTWSGTFPVGEELTITVTVKTAAAEWSGSTKHTVVAGANSVSIKLNKSAAALNSLLFGTGKPHASQDPYTLTLNIGSTEIKKRIFMNHSFCRDNKGRTYLAYQEGNDYKLERYTSEGKKEDKNFTLPEHCHRLMLASDHKTGKVYLVSEIRGVMTLFRINENGGSPTELTGDPILDPTGYAVYNNVVVASGYASGVQGQVLKMYGINGDNLSEIPLPVQPNLSEDTKIMLGSFSDPHVRIKDLYMTSDSLYVLFSDFSKDREYYSLGGIVKYSYKSAGTISNPKRIGIKESHTAQNGIYATDEDNFYGPVKVIGFDDENLYIADDGVRFEFEKGKPRIKENKNRIAALNRNDDTIIFTDAASGISWQNESPVWTGVNTKTLVWKVDTLASGEKHYTYYQLENANDPLPSETFNPGEVAVGADNYLTDVFCCDEGGNLYIVKKRRGDYQICRFELKDDGSYDQEPSTMTNNLSLSDSPTAIAVDISGSVKKDGQSVNALYYSYDDSDKSCIKRLTWERNAVFSSAAADTSFAGSGTFEGRQDTTGSSKTTTRFTSLAANKDGLFVGEFLKLGSPGDHKYKIHVKKYPHDRPNYDDPQGTIIIVDEAQQIYGIEESLNALYIQDGVLYGLTTKEFRNEHNEENEPQKASISGKLWKIGKTDFSGDSTLENPLYSSEPKPWPGNNNQWKECGKFAPYRFIAVKPKKLVIASDGFYGYMKSGQKQADQLQFIWNFDLKADGSTDGNGTSYNKGEGITFSKRLKNDSYFSWE